MFTTSTAVDPAYITHFLRSSEFLRTAPVDKTPGQLPRIRSGEIAETPLLLPPLDEQRRIAAILDQADDLRRKRRVALERLGSLISAEFRRAFGDPKLDVRRWPTSSFNEACEDQTSLSNKLERNKYNSSGPYPVVDQGQSEIAGYTDDAELVCCSQLPVVVFGDHTRCVKLVKAPFVIGADGAKVLKPFAEFDTVYFAHLLEQMPIPDLGYSRHMREVKRLRFPRPPLCLQQAFAARVAEITKLKAAHRAHLAKLDALFASLQHRAFRGEL